MDKKLNENYIKAIAEYRNISVAAESIGISQPALSSYLKKKETELGAVLFDRSKQPLELTDAGRVYLDYIEKSERLSVEMKQKLADIEGLQTGTLSVGGAVFFNIAYMPKAISAFAKEYPMVEINIADRKVPELEAAAIKGELDLFITPIPGDPDRFTYEKLADELIYIAVPSEWDVNGDLDGKRIDPRDRRSLRELTKEEFTKLCERTFVVLRPEQHIGQKLEELFKAYGVRPDHTIMAEQTMTTLALTLAGVGTSLVTESSALSADFSSLPALYIGQKDICTREIYVAYPKNKYLPRPAAEFIKILKEVNR
nr:LysR family transcriptional regulator [Candidatus Crickella merdequi]